MLTVKPWLTSGSIASRAGGLPRTVQLCVHCQAQPAGFWVSPSGGVTRRPWCLSCCQELDRDDCVIAAFRS
ncbi:MAG: hypothetical protein ABJB47_09720 [Actinomycetota bacterium]